MDLINKLDRKIISKVIGEDRENFGIWCSQLNIIKRNRKEELRREEKAIIGQ